ncbi:Arc family DNA-binding protein [Pseudothauera rhizosphaerae]|nr:Arc family DNA-binding protein [Pseudothauera rhizosphaerae]
MSRKPQDSESRHADKYIVRFPGGMRDRLKTAAEAAGRSLNAEIVFRLEQSFRLEAAGLLVPVVGSQVAEEVPAYEGGQAAGPSARVQGLIRTVRQLEAELLALQREASAGGDR